MVGHDDDRRHPGVLQRLLGQVELPEDPDQAGQYPVPLGPVDGLEGRLHRVGQTGVTVVSQGYISATGRTSTEPNLAEGTMAAAFRAWSRLSKSTR